MSADVADITVIISQIPTRAAKLARALTSVCGQDLQPRAIVVENDPDRTGAAATKNRALAKVTTEWTACLDSDDEFLPEHLSTLYAASDTADVVYSIPTVPLYNGQADPFGRYGEPFDADELRRRSYIPTTSLFRTHLLQSVGGFQCPNGSTYDDWGAYLALLDAGARFLHVPAQTWRWHIDGENTGGQPTW